MPAGGWDAILPQGVLTRLTQQHPNILLVGPAAFTNAALALIEPLVRPPVARWMPRDSRALPNGSYATLIIAGVDVADAEQQLRLCEWFDKRPRQVQVVSIAESSLYPLIQEGTFLEALYYRLNHICVLSNRPD